MGGLDVAELGKIEETPITTNESEEISGEGATALKDQVDIQNWLAGIKARAMYSDDDPGLYLSAFHLPSVVNDILRFMRYFPLWTVAMQKKFGFGNNTPSSAPVESYFGTLKLNIRKNLTLPARADIFLAAHIDSFDGDVILHKSEMPELLSQSEVCSESESDVTIVSVHATDETELNTFENWRGLAAESSSK